MANKPKCCLCGRQKNTSMFALLDGGEIRLYKCGAPHCKTKGEPICSKCLDKMKVSAGFMGWNGKTGKDCPICKFGELQYY